MSPTRPLLTALVLSLCAPAQAVASSAVSPQEDTTLDLRVLDAPIDETWDERTVEHLLNRAGFGARTHEVRRGVRAGQNSFVRRLVHGSEQGEPYLAQTVAPDMELLRSSDPDVRRLERNRLRVDNRQQAQEFLGWWVDRMVAGEAPLRERMTLFWHGFFTSDSNKVRLASLMIDQNELLRRHALGNFGDLLGAILRDPAMLIYLDNISNTKGNPNENLARELMELFSLGEGNYSEEDIRQVARALTGYGIGKQRTFQFNPRTHDFGVKTILGVEGRHDARDVVDILLAQPACARWVAGSIIEYLEGAAPSEQRLEAYADLLRAGDYELAPLLEHLFLDPEFYRPEIVGARVSSPIDYLVGISRRLGVDIRGELVVRGAGLLGQKLFEPPNVKGWNEGSAWITTSTLMNRGNLAGVLLGTIQVRDMLDAPEDEYALTDEELLPDDEAMMAADDQMMGADDEMMGESSEVARERVVSRDAGIMRKVLRSIGSNATRPKISITSRLMRTRARSDREIIDFLCDSLLAIEAPLETRRMLVSVLRQERETRSIAPGELFARRSEAEEVLRQLAHLILSLPEAQLG